jgi:hypothetical protein
MTVHAASPGRRSAALNPGRVVVPDSPFAEQKNGAVAIDEAVRTVVILP